MYYKQDLACQFPETSYSGVIPFPLSQSKPKERIVNSEMKHECWYIENPVSKELTKRITLKLGPNAEQEFIIVLRSP